MSERVFVYVITEEGIGDIASHIGFRYTGKCEDLYVPYPTGIPVVIDVTGCDLCFLEDIFVSIMGDKIKDLRTKQSPYVKFDVVKRCDARKIIDLITKIASVLTMKI